MLVKVMNVQRGRLSDIQTCRRNEKAVSNPDSVGTFGGGYEVISYGGNVWVEAM
jgi:hypothetical protein